MTHWLEELDRQLLLAINGAHCAIGDDFFWIVSGKLTWIPLYGMLLILAFRQFGTRGFIWFILFTVVTVALADLSSVHLFKNTVARYRPSHNLEIKDQLHLYVFSDGTNYRGGQFGFVSSHAANFAAIVTYVLLSLKKRIWLTVLLILSHLLICYSRIYLGVHYPADVAAGTLLGISAGTLTAFIFRKVHLSGKRNSLLDTR